MIFWVRLFCALTMPISSSAAPACAPLLEAEQIDVEVLKKAILSAKNLSSFEMDVQLRHRLIRDHLETHARLRIRSAKASSRSVKSGIDLEMKQVERSIQFYLDEISDYLKRRSPPLSKPLADLNQPVFAEIENKLAAEPLLRHAFHDQVQLAALNNWPYEQRVNLLLGSAGAEPTATELARGQELISKLIEFNNIVLLDGRSKLTPPLLELYPGRAFAVQATDDPAESFLGDDSHLRFSNSFAAFDFLRRSGRTIASFNSVAGIALSLLGERVVFVGDEGGPVSSLALWGHNLYLRHWHLGLRFPGSLGVYQNPAHALAASSQIFGQFPNSRGVTMPKQKPWREYPPFILIDWAMKANRFARGARQAQGPRAVIFGSGSMDWRSSPLVYDVAYLLGRMGVGVATGGSGGAMLAGNMGAYDAGAVSVGIPITGRAQLSTENVVFRDVQTNTVEATSYIERIPWLLERRELVLVAPGGSGTQREIAAALMYLAEPRHRGATLVLLNRDYFGPLYDWLQKLPLEQDLLSRIRVINNAEEILPLIHSETQLTEASVPRSTRKSLPQNLCPRVDKPKSSESTQASASGS